jgi:hypothetical protein
VSGSLQQRFLEAVGLPSAGISKAVLDPADSPCAEYNATQPCVDEAAVNACITLVDDGCTSITTMESCPMQFACAPVVPGSSAEEGAVPVPAAPKMLQFSVAVTPGDMLEQWCLIKTAAESGVLMSSISAILPDAVLARTSTGEVVMHGCAWCTCDGDAVQYSKDNVNTTGGIVAEGDDDVVAVIAASGAGEKKKWSAGLVIGVLLLILIALIALAALYLFWKKRQEPLMAKTTSHFMLNPAHALNNPQYAEIADGSQAQPASYEMVAEAVRHGALDFIVSGRLNAASAYRVCGWMDSTCAAG